MDMPGAFRRAMQYLGLVDDEADEYYEDDEYYDDARADPRVDARVDARVAGEGSRSTGVAVHGDRAARGPAVAPVPAAGPSVSDSGAVSVMRTASGGREPSPEVRPIARRPTAQVHVMAPRGFNDAQVVGERLRENQPVLLNLQNVERDLQRRLIDFSSGVTFALGGTMSKAADSVFLLTPSNVQVSEEEKERLEAEGLYRRR
jgi:cell division inhibitor SepF